MDGRVKDQAYYEALVKKLEHIRDWAMLTKEERVYMAEAIGIVREYEPARLLTEGDFRSGREDGKGYLPAWHEVSPEHVKELQEKYPNLEGDVFNGWDVINAAHVRDRQPGEWYWTRKPEEQNDERCEDDRE